jgi:hypothetical protein
MRGGIFSKCSCTTSVDIEVDRPTLDSQGGYVLQSGAVLDNMDSVAATSTQNEVLGFQDDAGGVDMDIGQATKGLIVDKSHNSDLGKFLERPTLITTINWQEGTSKSYTTFDPWTLFLTNTSIAKKLDNYAYIKANLKLKFVINASPFYYGCLLVSYQPLDVYNPAPIVIYNDLELIPLSQRPHLYLYPQNCQGGTMTLPFIYHKQLLSLTLAEVAKMGKIRYKSFGALLNANATLGQDCDINVYAWMEDIELIGPTVLDSMQSGEQDEYSHSGTISKPASAIARYTGLLSKIPIVGPYMTATSMVSSTVADVAALFGYTNVPVIDDVHYFKNTTLPHLASTDIGNPIDKLTLDSKNEVSIDPSVSGVALKDELNIANFCGRESFFISTTWTSADAPGALITNIAVQPHYIQNSGAADRVFYYTPSGYVANLFKYWRGDLIYRFKFICSQYHKGRVSISWSPTGQPGFNLNSSNQIYTQIVDITKNSDVEFRVPYMNEYAYLETDPVYLNQQFNHTTPLAPVNGHQNGVLALRVVNKQTSPVASADIVVLVSMRAAENIEFACPIEIDKRFGAYAIQSAEIDYDIVDKTISLGVENSKADPSINLVYIGESIKSLRTLINRSGYMFKFGSVALGATSTLYDISANIARNMLYPGYDPNGIHNANGINVPGTYRYNFVNWHPTSYLSMCFIGNRGAINWHASPNSNTVRRLTITRAIPHYKQSFSLMNYNRVTTTATTSTISQMNRLQVDAYSAGATGLTMTNPVTQTCVSAGCPMYSRYKFLSNNVDTRSFGVTEDGSIEDNVIIHAQLSNDLAVAQFFNGIDLYASAGADFSLIFFLNCPTLWYSSTVPAAI